VAAPSVEAAEKLAAAGISCGIIDLRTDCPLDVEDDHSQRCQDGRLLVVDEAYSMCGLGGRNRRSCHGTGVRRAGCARLTLAHRSVAIPFSPDLENAVVGTFEKIEAAARGTRRSTASPQKGRRSDNRAASDLPLSPTLETVGNETNLPLPIGGGAGVEGGGCDCGIPVIMPNMDLIVTEAKVVAWFKKIGETVHKGEALPEIKTDKAVTNVDSPADGALVEISPTQAPSFPLGQPTGEP